MRRCLLLGVLAAAACGGPKNTTGTATPTKKALTAKEIVNLASPAIVFIDVGDGDARGSGTGFILDKTGLIATNFHVVRGQKAIKVKLYGGEVYTVTGIAGIDPGRDLAVLKIQPTKALPTIRLGDSDQMSAGDQVITIGNPLGVFDYSVSSGLVSQVRPVCTNDMVEYALKNRPRLEELAAKAQKSRLNEQERDEVGKLLCTQELKYFQISAPISQGSSGGPLFNQSGEVVGVTTAIITAGQNINLAIPTNYLKPIVARGEAMSLDEFAKKTKDEDAAPAAPGDKIDRKVPDHATKLLDGCTGDQIIEVENQIWDAIGVGAPLYNKGEIEACFRIYEGLATKLEQTPPCKGIKTAFGDGLLRINTLDYKGTDKTELAKSWKLKAWAMRDTFDGILKVGRKWRDEHPGKWNASKLKNPDR
jgi:serine protease Do